MKKDVKKNKKSKKKYSGEVLNQIVGDNWYNNLSDEKREEIYKRHGEKKSPNK